MGTGAYGQSNPTTITCGFKPKMIMIGAIGDAFANDYYYMWENGILLGQVKDNNFKRTISSSLIQNSKYTNMLYVFEDESALNFNVKSEQLTYWNYYYLHFSLSSTGASFWCDSYTVEQSSSIHPTDARTGSDQHNTQGAMYQYIAIG